MASYTTQNELLMTKLLTFYKNEGNLSRMLDIINGKSITSLRVLDWFVTNYAKKYFTTYNLKNNDRFKVYSDYKLHLRAYSKRRFDPFCRWERIMFPTGNNTGVQTTIGQLNFFRWAIENDVLNYIEENYSNIEKDMNSRNSTSKRKLQLNQKTRKKREELSISATKTIKQENVEIIIKFD